MDDEFLKDLENLSDNENEFERHDIVNKEDVKAPIDKSLNKIYQACKIVSEEKFADFMKYLRSERASHDLLGITALTKDNIV